MQKNTVLVVDDHRAIVEGIKSALKEHPELEVIGECADGATALAFVETMQPDLLVLDISMPNLNGVEVTKRIQQLGINTGIIIYTMHNDSQFVVDLFKCGIAAFVLKEDPLSELVRALEAVCHKGTYFSKKMQTILARHMEELEVTAQKTDVINILSDREREVFLLFAEGGTVKDIASSLNISPKTVESHKYNIMEKLQIKSIVGMTKLAIRKNLISA